MVSYFVKEGSFPTNITSLTIAEFAGQLPISENSEYKQPPARALLLWKQTLGCIRTYCLSCIARFCASFQGMPELCLVKTLAALI
ncbi:hypothetical protein LOK49_LG02G01895 [Camellia lanceoleosa]|uniref:Uncharacterized protein n=1 Tax=Camellia lanceoleosa TaxID=1840588 RepID=A0ACC0IT58_9ERIC|nr:hypothetical protein LOK49_LG02G01895 [Camellia lanceoleosa]